MTVASNNNNDLQVVLRSLMDIKGEVGEIKGRLSEVAHETHTTATKVDAIGLAIVQIPFITTELADHKRRIALLEVVDTERRGAIKFGNWLMRMIPVGVLSALLGAVSAFFARGH